MAQNIIHNTVTEVVPYLVPSATTIASGDVVVFAAGGLKGVALGSGTAGETIRVLVVGTVTIPKLTTSGNVFAQGAKVYYDTSTGKASIDDAKEFLGYAFNAAILADTTVNVRLSN